MKYLTAIKTWLRKQSDHHYFSWISYTSGLATQGVVFLAAGAASPLELIAMDVHLWACVDVRTNIGAKNGQAGM